MKFDHRVAGNNRIPMCAENCGPTSSALRLTFPEPVWRIRRRSTMRAALIYLTLTALPLLACPNAEKAADAWARENFGGDDENPVEVNKKVTRINAMVSAVQLTVPTEEGEGEALPRVITAFFTGSRCEFAQQWDGAISDSIEAAEIKYLFIKSESSDEEGEHVEWQPVSVRPSGEIGNTVDQHGSELHFSQALQKRCEGKVGEMATWQRDASDPSLVVVRERRSDRDEKCRPIEDASTFRYYRLTAEGWLLDSGDSDAGTTTPAKRMP